MLNTLILTFRKNSIIIFILLAGSLLRLININQPILEFFPERQTQTAEITRNIYVNGWPDFWTPKIRYVGDTPTPLVLELPIYNGVVSLLYGAFSPNMIFGRLVSLFSFIVASIMFVLLLKKSVEAKYIFPSLLFFVFSPLHVLTSRSFQPDEMALALLLVSFYSSSLFVLMLSGFVKLPYYFVGSIILYKKTISFKKFLLYLIFMLPVLIWTVRGSQVMKEYAYAGTYSLDNWFGAELFFDPKWYLALFQIEHVNVFTTLGILFFTIGLVKDWKHEKIIFWKQFLFAGVLYGLLFNRHIITHDYYSLILIPPISVFIGIGLYNVLKLFNSNGKLVSRTAKLLVISLFLLGLVTPAMQKINNPTTQYNYSMLFERYNNLIIIEDNPR